MRGRGRSALSVFAALVLSVAAGADAHAQGAGAGAVSGARVHLVGAGDSASDLEARLRDLLGDEGPNLQVTSEPAFAVEQLFRVDDADAAWPTAWLVLDAGRVHVRAAGPGRSRFVFRDLDVGKPLTEFDRERLGQTVKAALATLVAGGAGALSLADAAAASGVALPDREPEASTTAAVSATNASGSAVGLAALYEGVTGGGSLIHNVGLIATLSGSGRPWDPELGLILGYGFPGDYEDANASALMIVQSTWVRATLSYKVAQAIRVGLGAGVDRETARTVLGLDVAQPVTWMPVGRLFARFGPTPVAGMHLSGTAFVEVTRPIDHQVLSGQMLVSLYRSSLVRPGFSVELWWR